MRWFVLLGLLAGGALDEETDCAPRTGVVHYVLSPEAREEVARWPVEARRCFSGDWVIEANELERMKRCGADAQATARQSQKVEKLARSRATAGASSGRRTARSLSHGPRKSACRRSCQNASGRRPPLGCPRSTGAA